MNVADRARHLVTWLVSNVYSRTFRWSIRISAHVQNTASTTHYSSLPKDTQNKNVQTRLIYLNRESKNNKYSYHFPIHLTSKFNVTEKNDKQNMFLARIKQYLARVLNNDAAEDA